jgi:uncharacterized protein involved in exopolysaccharide biosynthesis
MSHSSELSNPRLDHILHTLIEHRKLWLIPGLAALITSWIYVYFIRAETYTARQTLIVRDDLLGQSLKPGQFDSLDLMKSAQETILEIARKPQVIRNAMKTIGPANPGWFGVSKNWPTDKEIEEIQGSISLSAPNGAEFGHTETVVLSTKESSRERAAAFVLALLKEMDVKINEVYDLRLSSMKDELTIIRDSAKASLAISAERLIAMEREIGPDLPTLRALSDPQSGDGAMSQMLLQIRSERRQFENKLHSARNQRETLVAATHDPNAILATSDELFSFQPALSRLKQELIKAQSSLAESVGRYEPAHPVVQKHQEQVRTMHRQIHNELDSAKRGLESQIASLEQKVAKSQSQEAAIDQRFNRISSRRVDYLRLDEEVKKKSEVFNEAQGNLASIQRLDSKDFDVTLMTPVDEPQVSTRADGLGRTTTILGSGIAGFLAGFGLVLLLAPGPELDMSPREPASTVPPKKPRTDAPGVPSLTPPEKKSVPASNPSSTRQPPFPTSPAIPSALNSSDNTDAAIERKTAASTSAVSSSAAVETPEKEPFTAPFKRPVNSAPGSAHDSVAAESSDSPEILADENFQSRAAAIQAEIDAVAASSEGIQPEVPLTRTAPTDSNVAEVRATATNTKPQSVPASTPTAASILASLGKANPASAETGEPQQRADAQRPDVANSSASPSQKIADFETSAKPENFNTDTDANTREQEIELRRRASQRPLDVVRDAGAMPDQTIPYVSLEPEAPVSGVASAGPEIEDRQSGDRSTNPFLNPGNQSPVAQRMLEEAKAEAERQGIVPPVVPVKPDASSNPAGRIPTSTVPIPDQIKELTDSIASFAKPIERVKDAQKNTDF